MKKSLKRIKKNISSIEGQLQEKRPLLTINISNLKAPYPCGPNYHDVLQNTNVWGNLRKFKISWSKLPALLGSHGQEKFIKYWKARAQGFQKTNMPSIERSFYLLNTLTICVIFLYNWKQCIDGFKLLLQRYVRKGNDEKTPAIFSFCLLPKEPS